MTLEKLLAVFGSGEQLYIATNEGRGWIFTGTPSQAKKGVPHLLDRAVVQMYSHEGREGSQYCRMLRPGTAVVVEGCECGDI